MNVSELARGAGLSPSGVRWYEREGILPRAPRRENGYRDYSDRDASLLRLITTLRRLGLPAAEAGTVARRCLDGSRPDELAELLRLQEAAVAERRRELAGIETELRDLRATLASTSAALPVAGPVRVLFLCNANSGRSQMGEALLGQLGGPGFVAASAGVQPRPVSPFAVRALDEHGIDWSSARSKPLGALAEREFDYVVNLSESMREACATMPGRHSTLHWDLPDPGATEGPDDVRLESYRRVRDEIAARLRPFIELALRTARPSAQASRPGG